MTNSTMNPYIIPMCQTFRWLWYCAVYELSVGLFVGVWGTVNFQFIWEKNICFFLTHSKFSNLCSHIRRFILPLFEKFFKRVFFYCRTGFKSSISATVYSEIFAPVLFLSLSPSSADKFTTGQLLMSYIFSLKTTVSRRIQDGAKLFTTVYLMAKFTRDKNYSVYSMYCVISYLQGSPNAV